MIHYISVRIVNSLQIVNSLRVLLLVTMSGSLGGGVWKKRGEENLTKDTSQKEFGPPFVWYVLHVTSDALFFLYEENPRLIRPEALLEGPRDVSRGCAFSVTFPPPIRFAPPIEGATVLVFSRFRSSCTYSRYQLFNSMMCMRKGELSAMVFIVCETMMYQ